VLVTKTRTDKNHTASRGGDKLEHVILILLRSERSDVHARFGCVSLVPLAISKCKTCSRRFEFAFQNDHPRECAVDWLHGVNSSRVLSGRIVDPVRQVAASGPAATTQPTAGPAKGAPPKRPAACPPTSGHRQTRPHRTAGHRPLSGSQGVDDFRNVRIVSSGIERQKLRRRVTEPVDRLGASGERARACSFGQR